MPKNILLKSCANKSQTRRQARNSSVAQPSTEGVSGASAGVASGLPLKKNEIKTESFETLEVGRSYLSREGKVVEIKSDDGCNPFLFIGGNDETYTIAGRVWMSLESDRDLISRIVEPATLTIQRWGVVTKNKNQLLVSALKRLPYTFRTRREARRFAKCDLAQLKPIKIKCTYEVIK